MVLVVSLFQFVKELLENSHSNKKGEIHNDAEGKILHGSICLFLWQILSCISFYDM